MPLRETRSSSSSSAGGSHAAARAVVDVECITSSSSRGAGVILRGPEHPVEIDPRRLGPRLARGGPAPRPARGPGRPPRARVNHRDEPAADRQVARVSGDPSLADAVLNRLVNNACASMASSTDEDGCRTSSAGTTTLFSPVSRALTRSVTARMRSSTGRRSTRKRGESTSWSGRTRSRPSRALPRTSRQPPRTPTSVNRTPRRERARRSSTLQCARASVRRLAISAPLRRRRGAIRSG